MCGYNDFTSILVVLCLKPSMILHGRYCHAEINRQLLISLDVFGGCCSVLN